jgi:ABC-type multidrug transport system permease subunit
LTISAEILWRLKYMQMPLQRNTYMGYIKRDLKYEYVHHSRNIASNPAHVLLIIFLLISASEGTPIIEKWESSLNLSILSE